MIFWLLMVILLSATAVAASVPLIRRYDGMGGDTAKDVAVYDDQAKEVDRDLAAGAISAPEAKAAKAEIQKRLDDARLQMPSSQPIPPRWRMLALVACAGLIILGGVSLYGVLGSPEMQPAAPQAAAQKPSASADASASTSKDVETMINNLKARLKAEPGNAEGWRTLGWALFNTQKFQESADAYAKAVDLDPNNTDYKSANAEALVQAAQGIVVPKAQALIADVLAKDPKDFRARFYDALAHEQAGDQQGALDRWQSLLADTPADAPWREDVKQRVADMGKALGKDVSAALNAAPVPSAAGGQQAAAGATSAADQQAMIAGMVERLADKMKANPKDAEGWMRLMQAYVVLKQQDKAKAALTDAMTAFEGDADTQGKLKSAASALGLN